MKKLYLYLIVVIFLTSCSGMLQPKPNTDLKSDELWKIAQYGGGLLGKAYQNLNYNYNIFMDTYTDNAVPSNTGANSLALGNWTVQTNPIGSWDISYNSIKYINKYLEHAYNLPYVVGHPQQDSLKRSHRIGEAYFLRAWYEWLLLRDYGGYVDGSSQPMGFPIVTDVVSVEDVSNIQRNTYEECVKQIATDLDSAIARLPLQYTGTTNFSGISNRGRGSGLAAMTLRAKMYLYAASPVFNKSNSQQLWQRAAMAAAKAIKKSGGLTDLKPYGNFNDYTSFDYIWIQPVYSGNGLEHNYYPPSLHGNGNINPSQNLVSSFPARDGYPIGKSLLYKKNNPYKDRGGRFYRFIFYNGDVYNGVTIQTYTGGADASGGLSQQGTRTGYYMKKHLSRNVKLIPGAETTDNKFKVFLSRAELYLNFAEAANEAYGPNNSALGFSSADVLKKIRKRAGIDSDSATTGYQDSYLSKQASMGKNAFRKLIHNERRIELCFDGERFWDLRRWGDNLSHTIKGMEITQETGGSFNYSTKVVEKHTYQSYMRFVPLPFNEILILDNVKQNKGWK